MIRWRKWACNLILLCSQCNGCQCMIYKQRFSQVVEMQKRQLPKLQGDFRGNFPHLVCMLSTKECQVLMVLFVEGEKVYAQLLSPAWTVHCVFLTLVLCSSDSPQLIELNTNKSFSTLPLSCLKRFPLYSVHSHRKSWWAVDQGQRIHVRYIVPRQSHASR